MRHWQQRKSNRCSNHGSRRNKLFPFFRKRPLAQGSVPEKDINEVIAIVIAYIVVAFGTAIIAENILSGEPYFPGISEQLPVALLSILPVALCVYFVWRIINLIFDIKQERFGARIRSRLFIFFLAIAMMASLPQGIILMRLASEAQKTALSSRIRDAISASQDLALAWYDDASKKLEAVAIGLANESKARGAKSIFQDVSRQNPGIVSLELFSGGKSIDFSGLDSARMLSPPPALFPFSKGNQLASSASSPVEGSILRYLAPMKDCDVVLSYQVPDILEKTATSISSVAQEMEFLSPFSEKWNAMLILLYVFLAVPLLAVAVILALSASNFIVRPLIQLEESTRRVAAGETRLRIIAKPKDEIGRLIGSFNRMLGEIERYRDEEIRKEKIDAWKDIAQKLAHELRNPLTPIRLTAERVLRKWHKDPAGVNELIASSMSAIITEVDAMDKLLSDFRSFAALPKLRRNKVTLKELAEDAMAVYSTSYPKVYFDLRNLDATFVLDVDIASFKRALGNLILNAIEAMNAEGTISINSHLMRTAEAQYCRISIRDSGSGIAPELGNQVFAPYFTTKKNGTGIGLALVERVVSDHQGKVSFESEVGVGTTFYIDVPIL